MSIVYFADISVKNPSDNYQTKLKKLCQTIGLAGIIAPVEENVSERCVAIKLHFGEEGNTSFINPIFVREIVDIVRNAGTLPFLTDTCTLYNLKRHNAVDHLETAYHHGFTPYISHAPIIIADGLHGDCGRSISVKLKHFKELSIAQIIHDADAMVVLSHFKGDAIAGFGGAIKNLAMGCATRKGKIDMHGKKIRILPHCKGCGQCIRLCPSKALRLEIRNKSASCVIDEEKCIGCYACINVCQTAAIRPKSLDEVGEFSERIAEYAYGATLGKRDRIVYINFLMNITAHCDCSNWTDSPMVSDIGFLASTDPVAIDKASYDLVFQAPALQSLKGHPLLDKNFDKFRAVSPDSSGLTQISYGEKIGLGKADYQLITL